MGNIVCASNVKQPVKKAFHFPGPKATSHDVQGQAAKLASAVADGAASATRSVATQQGVRDKATLASVARTSDSKQGSTRATKKGKVKSPRDDAFSVPEVDLVKLAALKQRCLDAGLQVSKTELIRAGIAMLEVASLKRLVGAVENLEPA